PRLSAACCSTQDRDGTSRRAIRSRSKALGARVRMPVSRRRLMHHSTRSASGLIWDRNAACRYESAKGFAFGTVVQVVVGVDPIEIEDDPSEDRIERVEVSEDLWVRDLHPLDRREAEEIRGAHVPEVLAAVRDADPLVGDAHRRPEMHDNLGDLLARV